MHFATLGLIRVGRAEARPANGLTTLRMKARANSTKKPNLPRSRNSAICSRKG